MAAFGRISQRMKRLSVELKGIRLVRIFSHKIMTPMTKKVQISKEHFHGCSKELQKSLHNGDELWGRLAEGLEATMQTQSLVF